VQRRVCVTVRHLSVCPSHHPACHCCGFAAVGPACRRYQAIAARHAAANAGSVTLSADVGS